MLSYDEALNVVLGQATALPAEEVPLRSALGRVVAAEVNAPFDMPRFDNSAVDGYAVAGTNGAKVGDRLEVIGVVHAGGSPSQVAVGPECTIQVMTGAAVPPGTATVVMQEDVSRVGSVIEVTRATKLGRNVRTQGSEIKKGQRVLQAGAVVTPPTLALFASLGMNSVSVSANPRIGILATGDELVLPGEPVKEGQVFESNSFALQGAMTGLGMVPITARCEDSLSATVKAMAHMFEQTEIVVTSGGVSVGEHDFVRGALCELGFEILIPKVSIKPGKPFLFARRRDDGKTVFGLPGNPMSALCCFTVFVWPFLEKSRGCTMAGVLKCSLTSDLRNAGDRFEFVPGKVTVKEGKLWADPMPTPGSHSVRGLVDMDGFIQSPAGSRLERNDSVLVTRLPWGDAL